MTGPVRSWIHFFRLRDDEHAQKEIQQVAKAGKKIFKETFFRLCSRADWMFIKCFCFIFIYI